VLYLRNYCTYRQSEKNIKQQYLLYMSPQYGELRPTSGWDRFVSLGHHQLISTGFASWQRYCTRHSSRGRQPNCSVQQRAPPILGSISSIIFVRWRHNSIWYKTGISFSSCKATPLKQQIKILRANSTYRRFRCIHRSWCKVQHWTRCNLHHATLLRWYHTLFTTAGSGGNGVGWSTKLLYVEPC